MHIQCYNQLSKGTKGDHPAQTAVAIDPSREGKEQEQKWIKYKMNKYNPCFGKFLTELS